MGYVIIPKSKSNVQAVKVGIRGFAKLHFFWIEFNPPTQPPPIKFVFGNSSVTRPEHSNHNGF